MPKCKICGKQVAESKPNAADETTCPECRQAELEKNQPAAVVRPLDKWRIKQLERLGAIILPCPSCKTEVQLAGTCSQCGKPLTGAAEESGGSRSKGALGLLLVVVVAILLLLATALFTGMVETEVGVGAGIFVVFIGLALFKNLWKEFGSAAVREFTSSTSRRGEWLRFANRALDDESFPKEVKAKLCGYALCQPFVRLPESRIGDLERALDYCKKENLTSEVSQLTRDALNDLVFVEALDDCYARGYNPHQGHEDARFIRLISSANDSPALLQAAELIRADLRPEWLKQLLGFAGKKMGAKARNLVIVLNGGASDQPVPQEAATDAAGHQREGLTKLSMDDGLGMAKFLRALFAVLFIGFLAVKLPDYHYYDRSDLLVFHTLAAFLLGITVATHLLIRRAVK